jgi:hypothetical protein
MDGLNRELRCTLLKLSDSSPVRTPSVTGTTTASPSVGASFHIVAEGLTPGLPYRHVTTSPIVAVAREDLGSEQQYRVVTASGSRYLIIIHP